MAATRHSQVFLEGVKAAPCCCCSRPPDRRGGRAAGSGRTPIDYYFTSE